MKSLVFAVALGFALPLAVPAVSAACPKSSSKQVKKEKSDNAKPEKAEKSKAPKKDKES